ncbi:MAG: endonuclease/exonuclease/phosphatase family protein [Candidatus Acidiferrales bacterium]
MANYYVAWWNLENLFDIDTSAARPAWLQQKLASELQGWNAQVLGQKIVRLTSVIARMNNAAGPDLLGVCEVENQPVMAQLVTALNALGLPGRNYQVAHHDTQDQRGIDVAFIYDSNRLEAHEQFFHVILKREATRDLFQVNFKTKPAGRDLVAVGNHWPSRLGGQYESEPYRIVAAETLAYWIKRIQEIKGPNVAIVVMGDFNDEPADRSLKDYALSTPSRQKVLRTTTAPRLLNLMWQEMATGIGSHYFDNFPNMLDQFLVSKGFLQPAGPFQLVDNSVEVVRFPDMLQGQYQVPRRFGRPSSGLDAAGFSDHFPIGMVISET